jgi:putative MATE family efflux protein
MVLGWWIFPRMGVSGAALSSLLSQVIGMILILLFLFSGRTRIKLSFSDFKITPGTIWRILKIGIPALAMNVQSSLGNLVLTWFIAPFGTLAIAAHSIASRIQTFLYLPGMGLSMGAGVLVGQNLGAKQPDQAEKASWLAAGILEVFFVVCAGAILSWPRQIMDIFTPEAELVALGGTFLRIAAAGYLVMALSTVLQNCIAGAGDTVPNMIISIAIIWIVQMPLAYFLSKFPNLGVYGIRWAMVAAVYSGVIAYVVYFRLGRWKTKKI